MIVIKGRNVNALWSQGMLTLEHDGATADSRNGKVLVMPSPVMSVYERPQERVLLDPVRDANPFFHLMESLWMLAGRDDAAFLNRYVANFGVRFGDGPDDSRFIHGAYGCRWRKTLGYDQLDIVVEKLRANPDDRQAVIQMWDATAPDPEVPWGSSGMEDLRGDWRDRPCNTHVYLRVREVSRAKQAVYLDQGDMSDIVKRELDLTVLCRSNDIMWGAYGANAVHFSVLQEYLAGRIGVGIGKLYQFSNNYHGYVAEMKRMGDPRLMVAVPDRYATGEVSALPIGVDWTNWDEDLGKFMAWHDALWSKGDDERATFYHYRNAWFAQVPVPAAMANWARRGGNFVLAEHWVRQIVAPDWRAACGEWIQRRMIK